MNKNLKWLKTGAVLSAGLLLAACGSNEGTENSQGQEASAGENSEETVEITFWHAMNGPHQEALTALTEEFNESQDHYHVEELNQGAYDDLNQSITAAAVSGELPTMAQLTSTDVPELASNDILTPLTDDFLTSNGFAQETLDDIYPGFLDSSTFEGDRYAMPFSKSTRIMFYNQDILDEYGAEVPQSWEDISALGEQMTANGDDAHAMGLENGIEMEWETMARQNGSAFVDPEAGAVELNTPEAVEPLEMIQNMLNEGYARTAGEDGFMSGPFGRGESALYIGSSAGIAHVAPAAEGINWSTAPIPTYNGEELTLFAGNDLGLFSSATEEEQQGFVEYMEFLLQPENTAQWAIDTGYLPITQSALEGETYQSYLEENPEYGAAAEQLEYGMSSPTFLGYGEFRNSMLDAMESVTVSGDEPQAALDRLQQQTEDIIAQNN